MSMESASNFINKNMASIKDFVTHKDTLKLNIPHKVKKVMAGGSIKDDVVEDIENTAAPDTARPQAEDGESMPSEMSEPNNAINLAKLIAHMDQVHPRNENAENFGVCAALGGYSNPVFKLPCLKESPVSELAKELGIGPTMFLMSIKQLIKLFFVFMMMNMPIYVYLSKTHDDSRTGGDIYTFFASFTMGALGQGEPTCSETNLVTKTQLELKCGHPYATIEEINTIGIANTNENACATAQFSTRFAAEQNFKSGCYLNHNIKGEQMEDEQDKFLQESDAEIKLFIKTF